MPRHRPVTVEAHGMLSVVNVCTNGHVRPYVSWWELSREEQGQLDYVEPKYDQLEGRFFRYRGSVYDLHDGFERSDTVRAAGWDASQTESYFDAVIVRYFDVDGYKLDGVVVGHMYW